MTDLKTPSPEALMTGAKSKLTIVGKTGVDAAAFHCASPAIKPDYVNVSGLNERFVTEDPRECDGPDHSDDDNCLGCTHERFPPARSQAIAGWVVNRKRGDGIFMSSNEYDEASAAAEADIHDRGYFAVAFATTEGSTE